MGRFADNEWDPEFPNQGAFLSHNYEQALHSKRGRKALAELREALMALPEHKLIYGSFCTVQGAKQRFDDYEEDDYTPDPIREGGGEGVCAVGAFAWYQKVKAGQDPVAAFDDLPTLFYEEEDPWETAYEGQKAGLSLQLAWRLGTMNDEKYESLTPEERWATFVHWIDDELAKPYDPVAAR